MIYIERESRPTGDKSLLSGKSEGKLDHFVSSPLIKSDGLHVVKGNGSSKSGVAYNAFDFGNFLWGQAGKHLGFSVYTLMDAAHLNNAISGRKNNPGKKVGILDSQGDQRAIKQGFYYPKGVPAVRRQSHFNPYL
ncbi:hypothetical protein GCM10027051_30610 [Niabella terrae]